MLKNWGKELKEFILHGNVLDMAVGIIIGASFGKIVDSLVKDIIMPPIGLILGKVDFLICICKSIHMELIILRLMQQKQQER